jgi:hypothetical protein
MFKNINIIFQNEPRDTVIKLKTAAKTRLNHIQTASPKWHVLKHETAHTISWPTRVK